MNRKNTIAPAAFLILLILQSLQLSAQSPQKVSYQSIIRNASGELVKSGAVEMRISILQGSSSGTAVYVETHSSTTNINGLVTLEVGNGTPVTNTFSAIDWGSSTYFLKVEADPSVDGGTNYTITGISEILSVPYALHAKTAESVPTGTLAGQMQYWNGSAWVVVEPTTNEGATLQMIGGVPTWVGGTAPIPNVANPVTGKIWMDRNLGASQVATSSTDADAYGDLYQWGRGTDGHEKRSSVTTTTLSNSDTPGHCDFILAPDGLQNWRSPQNDMLWQCVCSINNPCPAGYRVPTESEWNTERLSWISNNAAGAFASPLKLPMAGFRIGSNGSFSNVNTCGDYWSSTMLGADSRGLYFLSSNGYMVSCSRSYGGSIRCIKD